MPSTQHQLENIPLPTIHLLNEVWGLLSRQKAAKDLDVGYPKLKRLLDSGANDGAG
jgi:hypothetical protein